jgi:predicted metalloprotease
MGLPVVAGGGGVIGIVVVVVTMLLGGGGGGAGFGNFLQDGIGAPAPESQEDEFVAFLSNDIQAVWADLFAVAGQTYELTTVNSFTGAVRTGCGTASSAVGPFYCPADREVYLDLEFFDELGSRFGAPGDFAQAYVVAHEVGHHVQNLLGTNAEVQRRQSSSSEEEANRWSVQLELQADCYAGVWAHSVDVRGRQSGSEVGLEPGDIEEGLGAAEAVGDDRLQAQAGVDVPPETWTHGSSEQRREWFSRGFDSGDPELCSTFAG